MQLIDWLDDLFRHMKWADAVVWRAVLASPKTESDERLRKLLYHIHLTQHAFLRLWSELPMEFPEVSDFQNLAVISEWGREYYEKVTPYISKREKSALDQTVAIPWAKEIERRFGQPPKPTSLAETMMQVVMHSTYHRGQVNARLRELGGEPPLCDYIAWLWLGKPQAVWPGLSKP